jgi:hypothetical protein
MRWNAPGTQPRGHRNRIPPGHVAALEHAGIIGVHGYFRAELPAQISGVAAMVKIAAAKTSMK